MLYQAELQPEMRDVTQIPSIPVGGREDRHFSEDSLMYNPLMPASAKSKAASGSTKASLSIFESEFNKLNDAQRKAVETIEGPVMVIAGPGTGKTQTLAMRVANILKKTHMRPSNILCLTFSVSGATAMRERLRLLIGADAYGVTVSTIHGFCQSIISAHPQTFEEYNAREQISDIEKHQEMNTIVDRLSAHSELINPKNPYGKNADLLSRISQVKREGKGSHDLKKALEGLRVQMEEKNTRARTESGKKKNLATVQKFADFIKIFEAYQDMLVEKGRYDYDDMILFVLKALKEEDWLLASLQERYQYILVDEAQDTNGAQWGVIETLTTNVNLQDDPNLFVVGDDDQAIYRFQGANLANMMRFHTRFPKAPVIAMTVSYRSTQQILTAAESLIEKNDERLVGKIPGLEKHLTAFTKEKGELPTLLNAPSNVAEPWVVAELIEERLKQGIPPEEIAVLTQTNNELFPLYDVFRSKNIPVLLRGKTDLLAHPVVAEALGILRALLHVKSDSALATAFSSSAFNCHPSDVSRVLLLCREKKCCMHDVLLDLETLDAPLIRKDALIYARDTILELSHKMEIRTVIETVEYVLRLLTKTPLDPLDLAAIEAFFQYTIEQSLTKPGMNFRVFFKNIEFYQNPEIGTRLTYELPHLVTEGVQLMTAHQSKGLEFHTVILTNFKDGHWDKRRKPGAVSIPEDLLFGWESDQKKFEQHQDERRVAFVAYTRAKRELVMTCPKEVSVGEKAKPVSPSAFFAEAGTLPEIEAKLKHPEGASLLLHKPIRNLDDELTAYIKERLETFALSATSLGRFLKDPQEFLRIDLLGQPEEYTEGDIRRLGYGNAVHWALKEWGVAKQKEKDFSEEDLMKAFAWYLNERTILSEKQREDLLALGSKALPAYFNERLATISPILYSIERDYRARFGDIPLKGKIDRIDLLAKDSGNVTVIDYKTGSAKTEKMARGGLEPGEVSRTDEGQNFRQLVFYAILLEAADPLIKPQSFALEFVGERGEDPERLEVIVTDDEKKALRTLIKEVWAKIEALDFTPLDASAEIS